MEKMHDQQRNDQIFSICPNLGRGPLPMRDLVLRRIFMERVAEAMTPSEFIHQTIGTCSVLQRNPSLIGWDLVFLRNRLQAPLAPKEWHIVRCSER
ncbi:MAG: hypothetical protein A3F09_02600 [Chlamydiae bacterium RIFCSPHIGHO2_12_FULL_49_11]|nr:MAG: hypothetical protein A3F09_02600 [Chlamydiae bacterium RIFCSPHIGHO2_12_FULL_49_11]